MIFLLVALLIGSVAIVIWVKKKNHVIIPLSVNYFLHRKCNYQCKFCFHTAKSVDILPISKAKEGLTMLKQAGMKKLNFSGGEPFMKANYLGDLVQFCKEELRLECVSIVSNGSLISEQWFMKYGKYLNMIAISCDSFNTKTLERIGRFQKGKDHLQQLKRIKEWCSKYSVQFKLNTVVNSENKLENLSEEIKELNPCRWKVFQCLLIDGENFGEGALRDARSMVVSDEEFNTFVRNHQACKGVMIPENNKDMKDSYLNLDEYMRFLNCQKGGKEPTLSILDVGVQAALAKAGFDEKAFLRRGGRFDWTKKAKEDEW